MKYKERALEILFAIHAHEYTSWDEENDLINELYDIVSEQPNEEPKRPIIRKGS